MISWFAVTLMALLGVIEPPGRTAADQAGPRGIDPRIRTVLAAEESRAATPQQLRDLADATRADVPAVQAAAARALGRLERRDVIRLLLPLLSAKDIGVSSEAANAVAQAFRGQPIDAASSSRYLDSALEALLAAPRSDGLYRAVGRLPYESAGQVRVAEEFLSASLGSPRPPAAAARGLESLARLRPRLAALGASTVERLRGIAGRKGGRAHPADLRRSAMLALVAWQAADATTVAAALDDEEFEIRRLATVAMAGGESSITSPQLSRLLQLALHDRSPHVRLEAVRAWARGADDRGCSALVNALSDADPHVVLAALDALGDRCIDDERISERLASEARTPPTAGAWQREAHALVALAKRSPDRAGLIMPAFATHPVWHVRLYAARAAAAIKDVDTLRRLSTDPDDTVVEATLPALRKLLGAESDTLFIAALSRQARTTGRGEPARPYQVFRAAAISLEKAKGTSALLAALAAALQEASKDRCETSRDARLALIARIVEFGSSAHAPVLAPLLRDADPAVAEAAAAGIAAWTGKRPTFEPRQHKPDLPPADVLRDGPIVSVEMDGQRAFRMAFYSGQAPLAKARFMRLVREGFYDGLTFHRVVPNFVIQGGSPNANEYCGDCPFMRDEVGLAMNLRGTVGVSTRGRDTGDAQFFVNLVDNPRLDHQYTVFAYVCPGDMDVVDAIQEGDRMRRVTLGDHLAMGCPPPR